MSVHDPVEAAIAKKLVGVILDRGFKISIWEGERWTILLSQDEKAILEALASTGDDMLMVSTPKNGLLGYIFLVYGNGEDLISDHSVNDVIDEIVNTVLGAINSGNY